MTAPTPRTVLETVQQIREAREADYGDAGESFSRIARLWGCYLDMDLTAQDVAVLMALFKLSRAMGKNTEQAQDDYTDAVSYAAFAAEFNQERTPHLGNTHTHP